MRFEHPEVLWALLAVFIPILIHLVNFQRHKRLLFPNLRFLVQIKQETKSQRNLKKWLILASRVLFVSSLVLAFAQPYLPSSSNSIRNEGQARVVVFVDNSPSMNQQRDGISLLDCAVSFAEKAIQQYPNDARFQIITTDFNADRPQFVSKTDAIPLLRAIGTSSSSRQLEQIFNRANHLLDRQSSKRKELLCFSDFQREEVQASFGIVIDSTVLTRLIPIASEPVGNIIVDTAWLETPIVLPGQSNHLYIKLTNKGTAASLDVPVQIKVSNTQIAAAQVSLQAGASQTIKASIQNTTSENLTGMVSINQSGVSFDNQWYFTQKTSTKIPVVVLNSNSSAFKVFTNQSIFSANEMTGSTIDLDKVKAASFLVVEDAVEFEGLRDKLIEAKQGGKSIFISPGVGCSLASYNQILQSLGNTIASALPSDTSQIAQAIKAPELTDAFFSGVYEKTDRNTERILVPRRFKVNGQRVLSYLDGGIAVASLPMAGGGTLFYCSGSVNGNAPRCLAKSALYLPMLYKMAFSSMKAASPLAYSFGSQPIKLALPSEVNGKEPLSLWQSKVKIIPGQVRQGNVVLLDLPKSNMASGIYALKQGSGTIGNLAINYKSKESDLNVYGVDELKARYASYSNFQVSEAITDVNQISNMGLSVQGTIMWKYLISLALFALALEIILLRYVRV